jgi:branched-chain amino acid transport system substrate-binding protein
MPLTGPISYLGQQELGGLNIGIENVNANGGVSGRKLQLVAEDTQGSPKNAVTIVQKHLMDKDVALFVVTTSKAVKAVASIVEPTGIPLAAICSDPDITQLSSVIFRPYMSFDTEAVLLSKFVTKQGFSRIAFIRGEDEVFLNEVKAFRKAISSQTNIQVVADESYSINERDFRGIIARVANEKPDILIALCWGFEVGALLEQKMQNPQMASMPVMGGYAFLTEPASGNTSQALMNGVYSISFDEGSNTNKIDDLRDQIQKRTGKRPNQFLDFVCAYDIPHILAAKVTGGASTKDFLKLIDSDDVFYGLAGKYNFKGDRDAKLPLTIVRHQNGCFAPFYY